MIRKITYFELKRMAMLTTNCIILLSAKPIKAGTNIYAATIVGDGLTVVCEVEVVPDMVASAIRGDGLVISLNAIGGEFASQCALIKGEAVIFAIDTLEASVGASASAMTADALLAEASVSVDDLRVMVAATLNNTLIVESTVKAQDSISIAATNASGCVVAPKQIEGIASAVCAALSGVYMACEPNGISEQGGVSIIAHDGKMMTFGSAIEQQLSYAVQAVCASVLMTTSSVSGTPSVIIVGVNGEAKTATVSISALPAVVTSIIKGTLLDIVANTKASLSVSATVSMLLLSIMNFSASVDLGVADASASAVQFDGTPTGGDIETVGSVDVVCHLGGMMMNTVGDIEAIGNITPVVYLYHLAKITHLQGKTLQSLAAKTVKQISITLDN